jgi:hypothetical protein
MLVGKRFNYLTVAEEPIGPKMLCACDCGTRKVINKYAVFHGHTKSCGCLGRRVTAERQTVHGMSNDPVYMSWKKMLSRCNSPKAKDYKWYGGIGITVSESWHKFENFINDMGMRPKGMVLDRIDHTKGYSKENCQWTTKLEQNNRVRRNRILTINGQQITMANAARKYKIPYYTLRSRIHILKWDHEKAVNTPAK